MNFCVRANGGGYNKWFLNRLFIWLLCLLLGGGNGDWRQLEGRRILWKKSVDNLAFLSYREEIASEAQNERYEEIVNGFPHDRGRFVKCLYVGFISVICCEWACTKLDYDKERIFKLNACYYRSYFLISIDGHIFSCSVMLRHYQFGLIANLRVFIANGSLLLANVDVSLSGFVIICCGTVLQTAVH